MERNRKEKQLSIDDVEELILELNIRFPIDRWWRKTHVVSFNSASHREVSFIDMFVEWLEDDMFKRYEKEKKEENPWDKYTPGEPWLKDGLINEEEQVMTDEEFSKLKLE